MVAVQYVAEEVSRRSLLIHGWEDTSWPVSLLYPKVGHKQHQQSPARMLEKKS